MSSPATAPSIQSVIDAILAAIPGERPAKTVDTCKSGDASQPVTGIAVTFLATVEVIQEAVRMGANFIITHEPTYYCHLDETEWLRGSPVYEAKRRLLEDHRIVVWRFHDAPHRMQPDAILVGMLNAMGWTGCMEPGRPGVCTIAPLPLGELVSQFKARLGIETLRFVGDPGMTCRRISLRPGAPGGLTQIRQLMQDDIDVLVTGEIAEWEASEYVRDAVRLGHRKALVVLGHARSEEAGMKDLVPWLHAFAPGVPMAFIPTAQPFRWVS